MTTGMLALALVLVGATIAGVLWVLRRSAAQQQQAVARLIALNEACQLDLLRLLDEAWPLLRDAGMTGLHWQLDWFGVQQQRRLGEASGVPWQARLEQPEVALTLTLHLGRARGEARHFRQGLAQTFWLLVQLDAYAKRIQVDRTLMQHQRVASFVAHDIKNIAQFVELAAQQVADAHAAERASSSGSGSDDSLAARLSVTMPLLVARCQQVLRQLRWQGTPAVAGTGSAHDGTDLRALLESLALLHGVTLAWLDATAPAGPLTVRVRASADELSGVLDNLIKNHRDHSAVHPLPPLQVQLRCDGDQVELHLRSPLARPLAQPERVFEPFAATNRQGMRIGLHQARLKARELGGHLGVQAVVGPPPGLSFVLRLPAPGHDRCATARLPA